MIQHKHDYYVFTNFLFVLHMDLSYLSVAHRQRGGENREKGLWFHPQFWRSVQIYCTQIPRAYNYSVLVREIRQPFIVVYIELLYEATAFLCSWKVLYCNNYWSRKTQICSYGLCLQTTHFIVMGCMLQIFC